MDLILQGLSSFGTFRSARRALAGVVAVATILGAAAPPAGSTDPADPAGTDPAGTFPASPADPAGTDPTRTADPADPSAAFPSRLEAAMVSGPAAWDRLWAPVSRDPSRRILDAQVGSLFDWSSVHVTATGTRPLPPGEGGASRAALEVRVTGTAKWRERAWGVAQSFWTLQSDERNETNAVVRREEWALEQRGGAWLAVDRRPLGVLQVVEARIVADVYPSQDVLLVEGSYYLRSLADGVQAVRFLLDRRASVYDLRVNGKLTGVVRGNELGSLGLEGYTPELESSFAFPAPLAAGEEVLVTFRLRAPLVHMTGPSFVTSLPIREGPFRERLWLPILPPTGVGGGSSRVDLTLRWPAGAFQVGIAGPAEPFAAPIAAGEEESSVQLIWTGDVRDADFGLLEAGADPGSLGLPMRWTEQGPDQAARIERTDPPPSRVLPTLRRERAGLAEPLLAASQASSQDLSTELQELLPLDDQLLNEMADDSATSAERGADDRQAQ